MNYEQARDYIKNPVLPDIELGLENIRNIMRDFGDVQEKLNVIHIAGTNGKGSVSSFISQILEESGYEVGLYTSPSVIDYREKMQINGRCISENEFAEIISELQDRKATAFELETAAALIWFYRKKCDFAVLETGMGGNLDATNVISKNLCSVITPVSIDHTAFLGNSIEEIAEKKIGIMKRGCPCVSAEQRREVRDIFMKYALNMGSNLKFVNKRDIKNVSFNRNTLSFDYKGYDNLKITMRGVFQTENAALALECIEALIHGGINIPLGAVYEGIRKAYLPARFETVLEKPLFIIDGAHNEGAAKVLSENIDIYFKDKRKIFIIGVMADKDYNSIIRLTAPKAETIYAVKPDNPRSKDNKELRDIISAYNGNVFAESVENAVRKSLEQADEDTVIIAFGSFYYLSDVKRILKSVPALTFGGATSAHSSNAHRPPRKFSINNHSSSKAAKR